MSDAVPIRDVRVSAYVVPTSSHESDGTLPWDKTTAVVVEVQAGDKVGLGFTYADQASAKFIQEHLVPLLTLTDAMAVSAAWQRMQRAVRNVGHQSVAAMAISAVDVALWDLKAQLLDLPLVTLLGQVRAGIPLYGSGGFTSYSVEQLCRQLGQWADQGFSMVKMKVGRSPQHDVARVQAARAAIGERVALFVDANGAYTRKQALHFAELFAEHHVTWFEEPVSSDDLASLHLLCMRAPAGMDIAAGEYGYDSVYFRRMLQAQAVDVLQADATRCGGITGFLQACALAAAWGLPLSAHTAPSVHLHACCASTPVCHLEYFHDHVRLEALLFDGVAQPQNGTLCPDLTRPGLGLTLRQADAKRYAA